MTRILQQDVYAIYAGLTQKEKEKLRGCSVLITGFAGSLGYMLVQFLKAYGKELGVKKVYLIDNYVFGRPAWIEGLKGGFFHITQGDVVSLDYAFAKDANLIFHMASLASPVYYRLHPIQTMDADVIGLRRLLDFYQDKEIYKLLFYSTSEIYGDPAPGAVPTPESYWGNVNTVGPRACYDESKRFGETLCYNFHHQHNIPVTVIRPFNSFGPGLRSNDKRVVADFAMNVLQNEDIVIYSDGQATRTFCYATDSTIASLKCALYAGQDVFNIGNDGPEMTVLELARLYQRIGAAHFGYSGDIVFKTHEDPHYTTDNPRRRCPDLAKVRATLGFEPKVDVEQGVFRYLSHLREAAQRTGAD
ncbi:MAG: NAD-dependent epimerase/dehydratase family protein [Christensenellales bacterium]|jgi:UDP-glucuronate decarboxylase